MTGTCLASIRHYENHNCIPGAKKIVHHYCVYLTIIFIWLRLAMTIRESALFRNSHSAFISIWFSFLFFIRVHYVFVYSVDCINTYGWKKITGKAMNEYSVGKCSNEKEKLNSGTQTTWSHHHSTSRTMQ